MGLESDWTRPLLESGGWLAAHRRKKTAVGNNAIDSRQSTLNGLFSREAKAPHPLLGWRSWSLRLFNELPVDDEPGLNDA